MSNILLALSLVSFLVLIIGLIKPGVVLRWLPEEKKNGKQALLYFGGTTIALIFVSFVITLPENKKNVSENEVEAVVAESEIVDEEDKIPNEIAQEALRAVQTGTMTEHQQQLVDIAEYYYKNSSKKLLIEVLVSQQDLSEEDATFAVEYISYKNNIDWQEQAVIYAKSLLEYEDYSKSGLIERLENRDLFTKEEANFAANFLFSENGVDANEQAIKAAERLLEENPNSSKNKLISNLVDWEGFNKEEATSAMDYVDSERSVDWQERANGAALEMLELYPDFPRVELIERLMDAYLYSENQATIAVDNAGL